MDFLQTTSLAVACTDSCGCMGYSSSDLLVNRLIDMYRNVEHTITLFIYIYIYI